MKKIYFNDYLLIERHFNFYEVTIFSDFELDKKDFQYLGVFCNTFWFYLGGFYCKSQNKDYIIKKAKEYIKEVLYGETQRNA